MQRRFWPPMPGVRFGILLLLPVLVPACRSRPEPKSSATSSSGGDHWQPQPAPDLGAVVGRVAGVPIFAGEIRAEMARSARPAPAAFQAVAELHLLAERARRSGRTAPLAEVPAALLVQRLLERDFEPDTTMDRMPDSDLRRAYQQVRDEYVHPRLVEVALLSVYTGPKMRPEPRARAREAALALAEELRRRPRRTPEAAQELAREPEWKARKVVFWRFWQGPDQSSGPFGGKVAPAITRLRRPGEQSGLIEDDSGYHFALYLGEKPARHTSFEEAKEEIRQKSYTVWRKYRFQTLLDRLAREHGVEVHHDRLLAGGAPARSR